MIHFTGQLKEALEIALREIASYRQNNLLVAASSIVLINETLTQLKAFVQSYTFSDSLEEIDFFKNIAPEFFALLIYFHKVYTIEAKKPSANIPLQKKHLQREYKKIGYFYCANVDFFSYYNSGMSDRDELLFLSAKQDLLLLPDDYAVLLDSSICPIATYKIAKLKAYTPLEKYIFTELDLVKSRTGTMTSAFPTTKLSWTDSKIAAAELAYSLYANKSFNNGKVELRDIVQEFEHFFNINLGTYHSSYQDMKMRKKSRTSFLEELRDSLERKMDEEED